MKPKMIWANVAVADLERTSKFYTALGFKPNGPHTSKELVSFFMSDNHFIMHFFVKDILQDANKGPMADPKTANEVIYTLSAETKEEVDQWAVEVEKAGGTLVSKPEEFGKGYYGFVFADPDGHRYNIFYM